MHAEQGRRGRPGSRPGCCRAYAKETCSSGGEPECRGTRRCGAHPVVKPHQEGGDNREEDAEGNHDAAWETRAGGEGNVKWKDNRKWKIKLEGIFWFDGGWQGQVAISNAGRWGAGAAQRAQRARHGSAMVHLAVPGWAPPVAVALGQGWGATKEGVLAVVLGDAEGVALAAGGRGAAGGQGASGRTRCWDPGGAGQVGGST